MIDHIPDNRNKIAYLIGMVFHPYLICIPTLWAVLNDVPVDEAIRWVAIVLVIILPPIMLLGTYMERRQKFIYQRKTRGPIYIVFWVSLMVCLLVLSALQAPRALIASIAALALWVPLQLLINTYITKVSTHAAVIAACVTGLLLLGKLNHPLVLMLVIGAVAATLWARVMTRNHTLPQVVMGLLVGVLPVLVVFSLML